MAIVQISRITQRKGLAADLPQLSGAELGYAVDERRLFIGNGTLEEGAPIIGNTEILTEFSNIFGLQGTYTYRGEAGGYVVQTGPSAGAPVTQSLQDRLDSYAIVTDFGAVGDGITDDTVAIQRAMFQLYCRSTATNARRGLFFPAGTYLITETIVIPPYAYLYGEGPQSSVIKMDIQSDVSSLNAYVVRTGDSLLQTGAQIGNNGAVRPQQITVNNMGFESLQAIDICLVDCAESVAFNNCSFVGPITRTMLATGLQNNISGFTFNSAGSFITNDVTMHSCSFSQVTYGVRCNDATEAASIDSCNFNTLYEGVYLDTLNPAVGGPRGFKVTNSTFDSVFRRGIFISDDVSMCGSVHNSFFDVATGFTGTPTDPVISINALTNCSVADLFERTDAAVEGSGFPRIQNNNLGVISIDNGQVLSLGNYQLEAAVVSSILDNQTNTTLFVTDSGGSGTSITGQYRAFTVPYTFIRGSAYRTGVLTVVSNPSVTYSEDYTENSTTGLTFSVIQSGDTLTVRYSTTGTGTAGSLTYSIEHLA
jgi:hypothetical protein